MGFPYMVHVARGPSPSAACALRADRQANVRSQRFVAAQARQGSADPWAWPRQRFAGAELASRAGRPRACVRRRLWMRVRSRCQQRQGGRNARNAVSVRSGAFAGQPGRRLPDARFPSVFPPAARIGRSAAASASGIVTARPSGPGAGKLTFTRSGSRHPSAPCGTRRSRSIHEEAPCQRRLTSHLRIWNEVRGILGPVERNPALLGRHRRNAMRAIAGDCRGAAHE